MLIRFRDKRLEVINRDREFHGYNSGQIVYTFFTGYSHLTSSKKKFTCQFVGLLAIWKCFILNKFVMMPLDGAIYSYLVEESKLKTGVIRTTKG